MGRQTPPRPFDPAAPPWLLAPSYPPWYVSPPVPPWSVIDHLPPRVSTPHPSGSIRLLPPSSPPWTLLVILLLNLLQYCLLAIPCHYTTYTPKSPSVPPFVPVARGCSSREGGYLSDTRTVCGNVTLCVRPSSSCVLPLNTFVIIFVIPFISLTAEG